MLNKKSSKSSPAWKLSILFPVIFGFLLFFNIKTEARIIQKQPSEAAATSEGISAHITKNTTKSELQKFEKEFAGHGVKLEFDHVKYSSAGILTRIDISVKDRNTGNKGSLNRRNPNGIEPIEILVAENGELSLGSATKIEVEKNTVTSGHHKLRIIDHASILPQDEPLMILNGIPVKDRSKVDSINPSKIKNITVLKGAKATALYGARGSNGVIIVSTKSEDKRAAKVEIRKNISIADSVENPNEDIYAYEYGKNNKQIFLRDPKSEKPLYIIDGEVKEEDFDLSQIQPENIAAINVLKGILATAKYGQKAKDGVIEIHTKEADIEEGQLFLIKASYSGQQLEALKAEILKKTGYDLQFNDIQRNEDGLITRIFVKLSGKGHMASANYETDGAIPDIHLGLKENGSVIVTSSK